MPRKPIDYTNAVIYKLTCKNPEITDIYVGSTTDFAKRKYSHKSACNNRNNKKHHYNVYQFIRDNGSWDNWQMVEIERYQATDKLDLEKRERYWLEDLNAGLNSHVPTRTKKEYMKQYCEDNRDRIANQRKGYMKQYREKHKEHIAEYHKEYRKKEKIVCECGSVIRRDKKARHERSKKHQKYIASL